MICEYNYLDLDFQTNICLVIDNRNINENNNLKYIYSINN